jgi:hypothetical protein
MISTVGLGCALLDLRLAPYIATIGRETLTACKTFPAREAAAKHVNVLAARGKHRLCA